MGLADGEAADVVQTTWLRLVERLADIREPEHLGSWLATTARREALRQRARARPAEPLDPWGLPDPAPDAEPDAAVFATERARILWAALRTLPDRCQQLLRLFMADPPPTYDAVSAALDIPVGAIGPTRRRCLDLMRRNAGLASLVRNDGGAPPMGQRRS